jgi:very-short-patch-repair endonuclease
MRPYPRKQGKNLRRKPRLCTRVKRMPRPGAGSQAGDGRPFKSKYEKRCAQFLSRLRIRYQYEPLLLLRGKSYRPDFFLPDYNLFVEICGYSHMPYYRSRTHFKEQIYEKAGLQVLFIHAKNERDAEEKLRVYLQERAGRDTYGPLIDPKGRS